MIMFLFQILGNTDAELYQLPQVNRGMGQM